MTVTEPSPSPLPLPALPSLPALPLVDNVRAEGKATHLCNVFMQYCAHIGISTDALSQRTGVSIWTIRGLRHRKIKNFPQLLNFVKLLAAADLELQIVRVQQGLVPDDPTNDPAPPPHYHTGTEGNLQWPSA